MWQEFNKKRSLQALELCRMESSRHFSHLKCQKYHFITHKMDSIRINTWINILKNARTKVPPTNLINNYESIRQVNKRIVCLTRQNLKMIYHLRFDFVQKPSLAYLKSSFKCVNVKQFVVLSNFMGFIHWVTNFNLSIE